MARLRAVVMIHPAGAGGTPVCGQRCNATVKAHQYRHGAPVLPAEHLFDLLDQL
jgi:hypothetical protein